jgi:thioester reductase-like protein
MADLTMQQMQQMLAAMQDQMDKQATIIAEQQAALEAKRQQTISFKRGALKGNVIVYGLQRMPTTLYYEQWKALFEVVPQLDAFLEEQREANLLKLKGMTDAQWPTPEAAESYHVAVQEEAVRQAKQNGANKGTPATSVQVPLDPPRPGAAPSNNGIPTPTPGNGTLRPQGTTRPMNGGR